MLHEDHMLVMPLPQEMPGSGKYPDHKRLKSIMDSIEKQRKLDPKNTQYSPPKSRFTGGDNPFSRDAAPAANLYNPGGEMGTLFPGFGKGKGTSDSKFTPAAPQSYEPPEHVYVRVYDAEVQDGRVYEYRVRVRLKNPNFGKKEAVSKASDADNEELPPQEDHWFVIPQKVSVPQAGYHYVVEYTPPKEKEVRPYPTPREGQAVIQFQRWYEYLDLPGNLKEPIGDWVQAEMLATRGMFVSGKAFAPLPFWSSIENAFILREIPGEKTPKGKDPRKGAIIEPIRPKSLLAVDVAGGKIRHRMQPNPGERTNRGPVVDDEAASEVLFLYPDGSMELRTSARDKADADRKEREEHFKKWVKETDDRTKANPTNPKGPDF
jgi:hypothetical protein